MAASSAGGAVPALVVGVDREAGGGHPLADLFVPSAVLAQAVDEQHMGPGRVGGDGV